MQVVFRGSDGKVIGNMGLTNEILSGPQVTGIIKSLCSKKGVLLHVDPARVLRLPVLRTIPRGKSAGM